MKYQIGIVVHDKTLEHTIDANYYVQDKETKSYTFYNRTVTKVKKLWFYTDEVNYEFVADYPCESTLYIRAIQDKEDLHNTTTP
jgi:hypothetical protein